MSAPVAPKVSHTWNRPTGPVDDPWAWLRDRDNPATIAYLEAENAHSREWFAQRQAEVDTVFAEIKRRVQETDLAAPVFHGGWWYATRTEEGANYPIHCRGRSASQATEHVILDENVEAGDLDYFALGVSELNHDHTLLAWSADNDGSEKYTLHIRDLTSGNDLADELVDTTWAGAAWSADHQWLFYVTADEQMRPCTVWRHRVGTPQTDDVQVFHDPDERFFVGVELTRSGEFIMIESGSKVSSEIHVLPSSDPTATPHMVRAREADVEYSLDHWGDQWVVLTNLDAVDFRVCTAPHDAPDHWTELVPHVPGQRIAGLEAFRDHLVLSEWVNAQPRLRVLFRAGGERVLDISDEPHDVELESNPDYVSTTIRYATQSLTKPGCVYEVEATGGAPHLLKATPTPNTDLTRYTSSRHWAVASDGTRVPVDIVHHIDTPLNGTAPIVVYGYGSYEISLPPWFSVARLSLLDRGVVWALVHPRGGGELGRRWYLDGKLLHKRNTFTDTIACIEHLVATGVGAAHRVAIRGGSAGGLLVGAVLTMRPDLVRAVVAEVPFVDVVNSMSDATLPLTVTEWEEWGDPRSEPFANYIASYSPYDNTVAMEYPALFITAGLNDPRVSYHEPAKWIARIRDVRTNDATLLMWCEMGAGHGGPSGRYDAWREEARTLTFLLTELGVTTTPA